MTRKDKLTKAETKKMMEYRDKWTKIGSCTDPADRPRAEAAIKDLYKAMKLKKPEFIWVDSPFVAMKLLKENGKDPSSELYNCWWGQMEAGWICFYKFAEEVLKVQYSTEDSQNLESWAEICKSACWWWPYEETCIICERPSLISWEQNVPASQPARLHSSIGPAVQFRDGYGFYCYRGIRIPEKFITEPVTIEKINGETNQEFRRILIDLMGPGKYMKEAGGSLVHKDEYGELYRLKIGTEDLTAVKVLNSTSESDGSIKEYWLHVHPELRPMMKGEHGEIVLGEPQTLTAKAAVASTFGMRVEEYDLVAES